MASKQDLLDILKSDQRFGFEELIKYLNVDEKTFFAQLITLLTSEVYTLDFDADIDRYKYLYKIFKYFDSIQDENTLKYVKNSLKKINEQLEHSLDKAIKDGTLQAISFNVIAKIVDIIDVTLLKLNFDFDSKLDKNYNDTNYRFLCELIYNIKNYDYVFEIFKTSSMFMYTTNSQGVLLFDELIEHYLKLLTLDNNHYDILYFEKVIKIFLDSKKFNIDSNTSKKIIEKFLLYTDRLKRYDISSTQKKKVKFFLQDFVKYLKSNNSIDGIDSLNYKYDIHSEFSDKVLASIKGNPQDKGYLDLRNQLVVTIDSPGSVMFDDAYMAKKLSDGTFVLGVFVADVDAFIKPSHILDKVAFKKAESIYLHDTNIPMFPRKLTKYISLDKDYDSYTIGYFFHFDPKMQFMDFYIRRCLINVKYNLDYYSARKDLKKCRDIDLYNTLKGMISASNALREDRLYDSIYEVRKGNNLLDRYKKNDSVTISTFTILTNHFIARYFNEHKDIPFPYRVNLAKENDYMIKDLKDKLRMEDSLQNSFEHLQDVYIPSFYAANNLGHYELNLKSYSNVTNPLRQYMSLVTERLVKRHMIDGIDEPLLNLEEMENICEYINNRQKLNFEYGHEYMKIKKKSKN